LIIAPQIISYFYFPLPESRWDTLLVGTGSLLFFIGLWLDIWARLTMRKYWGPPGTHDDKRQTKLLTHGPYSISRNPTYLGTILLIFGFSLALRSIFFFLPVFLLIYFIQQIEKEEKLLKHFFGQDYERYTAKVPRFIGYKKFSI
jgi:protein-S-isoprenylcysteine O-methyltransferase Ste14